MSVNLLEEPSHAAPASRPLHFGLAWSTVLTASSTATPQNSLCFLCSFSPFPSVQLGCVETHKGFWKPRLLGLCLMSCVGRVGRIPNDSWMREALKLFSSGDLFVMNKSTGNIMESSQRCDPWCLVLSKSFAFKSWAVCMCVHACVHAHSKGERSPVSTWVEIQNISLPAEDDLREWVPVRVLYYPLLIGQLTLNSGLQLEQLSLKLHASVHPGYLESQPQMGLN